MALIESAKGVLGSLMVSRAERDRVGGRGSVRADELVVKRVEGIWVLEVVERCGW